MKQRKAAIRTCVGCRSAGDKRGLIRIVRTASGQVMVDTSGKMPGRGAYLCPKPECLRRVLKEKRLPRALRGEVTDEAVEQLRKTIEQGSEDMQT